MKSLVVIASLCILAAVAFADPAPSPPQQRQPVAVDSALCRFALDAHDAETIRPLLIAAPAASVDRLADLERRVADLEASCKCQQPAASYIAPQPAESKPVAMVCDASGCRIVSGSASVPVQSSGNYSSGNCGVSGSAWQPFGGRFRRR